MRLATTLFVLTLMVRTLGLPAAGAQEAVASPPALASEVTPEGPGSVAREPEVVPEVTLELIMAHPDWLGNPPEEPYWAEDGQSVYYLQKHPGAEYRDLLQMDLRGVLLRAVELGQEGAVDAPGGSWNRERTLKVFARRGDIFLQDVATGEPRQLTRTLAQERAPRFLADGRRITFLREGTAFVRDLETGLELEPADLRAEQSPEEKEKEAAEKADYLTRQQERLFDILRKRKADAEAARERELAARRDDPTRIPPPFYLGEDVEIRQVSLSPGGEWMLVVLGKKDEKEGRRDVMPAWVTADGYVETETVRPKVGTGEGAGEKLLLLDLLRHESQELDLGVLPGIAEDPLARFREQAGRGEAEEARSEDLQVEDLSAEEMEPEEGGRGEEEGQGEEGEREAGVKIVSIEPIAGTEDGAGDGGTAGEAAPGGEKGQKGKEAKHRPVRFWGANWSEDGARVALIIRSEDNKDRWIATVDFAARKLLPVHHLHDEAWINWDGNEMGWMPDGSTLWYLSEESGYSHLYLAPLADGTWVPHRQLTAGNFEVSEVTVTRDGRHLYFRANREHPGSYEIYRVSQETVELERLTRLGGENSYVLSPDENQLLLTHSTTTEPPELYLQPASPGAEATRLTRTVSDRFAAIDWVAPEIVAVPRGPASPAPGEAPIYSRLYLPVEPADGPRPAVIFIHGAGYLQNAHQGWSDYFREFMFHTFLTRHGYVVLDMDYRGSAGYGRDWRTAIYRHMGGPEVDDLASGIDYLVTHHGVDRGRVGTYGGSYGGFLTLMALFTRPDLFAAGAALRPVTDWAHYNHPYTSNILNIPEVDPEAYERSSPIEFADGLEKPLLICAPMQDDNVLFEDVVRLAQRLIELGKEDWEVALYPIEPHGFRQPSSWLDEYRRIFKLMERHVGPEAARRLR